MSRRTWRGLVVCVCIAGATALPAAASAAAPEPIALPAPPGGEAEPNDGPAQANPIQSGERIRANLAAGDVDYYRFEARAEERVFADVVTSGSRGASKDSVLALLESDGATVNESDDDDGSQGPRSSSIAGATIPADGVYYLRVSDKNGETEEPYDLYLQLRGGEAASEVEPDDRTDEAQPLGNGEVDGSHALPAEEDWYSIQLQAGDTVFLSLDISGDASRAQLGFGLAGDPDKKLVPLGVPAPGEPPDPSAPSEALTMTVSSPGTYYAWVGPLEGTSLPFSYDLSATVISAAQPSCRAYPYDGGEIHDGATTSFPIAVGDPMQIVRASVGIDLEDSAMADLDLSLRDPAGVELPLLSDFGSSMSEKLSERQTQMQVLFDDYAAVPPLYKRLRPLGLQPEGGPLLGLLANRQSYGTWSLVVDDDQLNGSTGVVRPARLILCGPESLLSLAAAGSPGASRPSPPALSGLAVAPGRFRAAKSGPMVTAKRPKSGGALVSYQDSQAAQTNFVLSEANPGRKVGKRCRVETKANAARKPCTRWVKVISFVHQDRPGRNRFGFTGRVGARRLPPGEFRLRATAYAPSGLTSGPAVATFEVLAATAR